VDFLDEYMAQSSELVGDRTPDEIAYDNAIIKELRKGRPIIKALKIAAGKFPDEALEWNKDTIDDIAAHYDYLMKDEEIRSKVAALSSGKARKLKR